MTDMAILPFNDDAPRRNIRYPYVTYGLIAACLFVFIYQLSLSEYATKIFWTTYGTIPAAVFGNGPWAFAPEVAPVPPWGTLFSSMYLHAGFMHIIANMLFLWVLGDNVEDSLGHVRYLCFYSICGIIAALAHSISDPVSHIPMIGASGAVSGVIGAYLVLHPRAPIRVLLLIFIIWLPAWVVLGFWIGYQIFCTITATDGGVAWWAHIAGFFFGAVMIIFMRRRGTPIFDQNYVKIDHRLLSTRPRKSRHQN